MSDPNKAPDWQGAEPDTKHGFQLEPGFEITDYQGELVIPVIGCKSDLHPEPKKRCIQLIPPAGEGKPPRFRVHDRVKVHRTQGKQVIHDRWTSRASRFRQFIDWAASQIREFSDEVLEELKEILGKIDTKLG